MLSALMRHSSTGVANDFNGECGILVAGRGIAVEAGLAGRSRLCVPVCDWNLHPLRALRKKASSY